MLRDFFCFFLAAGISMPAALTVAQSERKIPVAYEVDVAVVGGTTGAVAAAKAAAETGARVFLAAPYPYLGEDLCATMRLWLEEGEVPSSELAKAVFAGPERRGPFRPMQIKKALDEALLAARVQFLFSSYVTDVLVDGSGKPAGIVMANRAGRQAVLAKVVIDATERGTVARLAGARFSAFPSGRQTFHQVIVGGEGNPAPGATVRKTGLAYAVPADPKAKSPAPPAEIYEYTLSLPVEDGSFGSMARVEQAARDLTYSDKAQANTDALYQVPPAHIKGAKTARGAWPGAARLNLASLRPAGLARLWVLSGAADVSRDQAGKLMRPLALMELGERVGRAAGEEARRTPEPAGVTVRRAGAPPAARGEVHEPLLGPRSLPAKGKTVISPAQALPVLGTYDVVVVGGGTGGAPAGIGAARKKARTLVIEFLHELGGVGTTGMIASYYYGYREGFTKEVPGVRNWSPMQKAEWWRRTLRQAGADVWFGVIGCGAYVEGKRVSGVVVSTPLGRGVVLARTVIDGTGNSDIAASAGAETMYTDGSELAQQGTGLPRVKLGPSSFNTDFTITDETDMLDVWHLMVYAKNKYANEFDLGKLIDTRERRRIVGDMVMTVLDQINRRTYPDTIAVAHSNFDTHGYTIDPYFLLDHPQRAAIDVDVPYRIFLPKGLDGIYVIGLGVSAHRDAIPVIRMQPDIQNHGYAIGMAAAEVARRGISTRALDVRALQKELAAIGIVPERVLQDKDSFPFPPDKIAEAVKQKNVAMMLTQPEVASPLLRQAWREASGEDKLIYAQILAVLGDATGIETILAAVDAREWDAGWKYKGMSQFGPALSPLDGLLVALGRTRDRRAVPAILRKAERLDPKADFSHWRAVALALEAIGDPSAAPGLERLLKLPGLTGYAHTSVDIARARSGMDRNDNQTRDESIRELGLARALYRCGDPNGLGRKILTQYSEDLRGHFARHARAVLEDPRPQPR